jgi:hypothetical protein
VRLFFCVWSRYVDDLFSVVAEGRSRLDSVTRTVVEDILGWKLDPGKSVSGVTSTTVLGVVVTLLDGALQFHIDEAHLRKWCYDIDAALDSGRLSPSCTGKLVGNSAGAPSRLRLSRSCFSGCWTLIASLAQVFGRSARVFLAALHMHANG